MFESERWIQLQRWLGLFGCFLHFPFRALQLNFNNCSHVHTVAIWFTIIEYNIMQYNLALSKILMFLKVLSLII